MARRPQVFNRLALGPVVGHTDETSTRIWIRVFDDPRNYKLRVYGVGLFDFESTEGVQLEFRTAIAVAAGLLPDRRHRYSIVRLGRVVPGTRASFRTMPARGSMANLLFCAISCSKHVQDGVWNEFAAFVKEAKPHFILMMGDQVYVDEDTPNVFNEHFKSRPDARRAALVEKYELTWSRKVVREVLANFPCYMVWDDHDIRDGWGSVASDSPALLARYPRGREIYARHNAFFEDCRDVYWHFQACHNPVFVPGELPPNVVTGPPLPGERRAMPFAFRCARLVVVVLDTRGARDVFRPAPELPILGAEQWAFVEDVFAKLDPEVEALAIVTPTPIASMDPDGQVQRLLGDRTDDVEKFKRGNADGVLELKSGSNSEIPITIANVHLSRITGVPLNLGTFMLSKLDEARDQWSHKFSRGEQMALLRQAGAARLANAAPGTGRALIFLSGDIHVGCIFDITSLKPPFKAVSLTSSGISALEDTAVVIGTFLDEKVPLGGGFTSTLRDVVRDFNFGVVQVLPTGAGAQVAPALAHEGNAWAAGANLKDLL
ncbi:MAG: alkaline phosphatase family protein [Limnobacter sp.]|nr:alkaline phosphatase family protein [Limnobacter sp.]